MVGNQVAANGTEGRQKGGDIVEVVAVVVGKGGSQNSVSKFCTFCCEVRCCLTQHNVTASLRACLQYRSVFKTSHG